MMDRLEEIKHQVRLDWYGGDENFTYADGKLAEEHRSELLMMVDDLLAENKKLSSFGDHWVCQSCGIIVSRPWGTPSDVHYTVECSYGRTDGKCKCGADAWLPKSVHDFLKDQNNHLDFVRNWDTVTGGHAKINELQDTVNRVTKVLKESRFCENFAVMELWDSVLDALVKNNDS